MTAQENLLALFDTLGFFDYYDPSQHNESHDSFMNRLKKCYVYLPEDIHKLNDNPIHQEVASYGQCKIACENADTFTMAYNLYHECSLCNQENTKIMALNFANPYNPGGGVRWGANAQEEDLCRRSNLLISLESEEAKRYYQYNKENRNIDACGNDYGTTSMILTPNVTIIKDKAYQLHFEFATVSVLTVAAPIIQNNQCLSDDYIDILFERINAVLLCAAHHGYTHLILGAWGCGAFGNDPTTVAGLFRDAIDNFHYNGKDVHQLFESIIFAVPLSHKKPANYEAFAKHFNN